MKRLYSPSTGNTYLLGLHVTFPQDAVEISEETFLSVIANPLSGKIRGHDEQGQPTLLDPPEKSLRERLASAHSEQLKQINMSCENSITGGFWSSALGENYFYDSQLEDQLNMAGVMLTAGDTVYACRDESGLKDFRPHSNAQMRRVGEDFTRLRQQLLQRANTLKSILDEALEAGDLAAIEVVTW